MGFQLNQVVDQYHYKKKDLTMIQETSLILLKLISKNKKRSLENKSFYQNIKIV